MDDIDEDYDENASGDISIADQKNDSPAHRFKGNY